MKKIISAGIVITLALILTVFSVKTQNAENEKRHEYKEYLETRYETLIEQAYEIDNVNIQIQFQKDSENIADVWVNNVGHLSENEQEKLISFLQVDCPEATVTIK